MPASARILAIDDQPYFRRFLQELLSEAGYEIVLGATADTERLLRESGTFDLVLLDAGGQAEWRPLLERVRSVDPSRRVLALFGPPDVERAVAVMKAGAADYVAKPAGRERLLEAVAAALERAPAERRRSAPAPDALEEESLIDENLRLMGQLARLERVVPLLTGLDLEPLAAGILELLCVEVAASSGELWLRGGSGRPPERIAGWGSAPIAVSAPGDGVLRALQSGVAEVASEEGGGEAGLLIPLRSNGHMLGAVRVAGGPRTPFGESDLESCAELAERTLIALQNALRVRELETESLRDPRTRLPGRGFFDAVLGLEIHRAHRFGRRLCAICIELHDLRADRQHDAIEQAVHAMSRTLRTTDLLCSDGPQLFWVLVSDTDRLGGVVLKRRLADRVREAIAATGCRPVVTLGVASYPLDGETPAALVSIARSRASFEQQSVIHELGFKDDAPLTAIGERLLRLATPMPATVLAEIAEFLIGEITCRPHDSGLLFLAPGNDPTPVMGPLMALGDTETAMEVFLATDGDTVPACPALTAVALPPSFDVKTTWIVRFGEGPSYALVAGPPLRDGTRPIYHSSDPVLVEQMTFRLCAELGVGVRN